MQSWIVRIEGESFRVEAPSKRIAELYAAREYVMKYPNANIDTHKVLNQYKIKTRKEK